MTRVSSGAGRLEGWTAPKGSGGALGGQAGRFAWVTFG
jgi:hypothetical protein